jgi:hypothetical protein
VLLFPSSSDHNGRGFDRRAVDRITTTGRAVVLTDPSTDDSGWLPDAEPTVLRIEAADRSEDRRRLFVGVAESGRISAYLSGVAHVEVAGRDRSWRRVFAAGEQRPQSPGSATFWTARTTGASGADLEWRVDRGDWAVVVMRTDGRPGLDVSVSLATRDHGIRPASVLLVVAGGVLVLVCGAVLTGRRRRAARRPG